MANYTEHIPLKGSERVAVPGAKAIGAANPDERLQVTVLLRSRAQAADAKAKNTTATANEKSSVESLLKQRAAERHSPVDDGVLGGGLVSDLGRVEGHEAEDGHAGDEQPGRLPVSHSL